MFDLMFDLMYSDIDYKIGILLKFIAKNPPLRDDLIKILMDSLKNV